MSKWYTPLTASAQAAFANIVPAAQSMEVQRSVSDLPGGFAQKKLGQKVYCYYQFKSLDGKTRQIYLGKDSDSLRQLMDKFKAMTPNTAAAAHLARLCRSAIELGAESVGRTHFRILQRLADHGFFHAGGILIGTHAFLAYQNHFGIRWTEGNQTLDIDFAHPGNNLSIALPDGLQMDARSAIDSLEMGFIPNVSQTTFIKQDEPDLQLDFVTPKVSTSDAPIRVHALNLSMQPLRFMDFSMDTSMQAVLISRNGPVVVTVPRAERYALHKLIVFGERPADMQAKAQKDLAAAIMSTEFQEVFNLNKGSIPVRLNMNLAKFDDCAKLSSKDFVETAKSGSLVPSIAHQMAVPSATTGAIQDAVSQFWNDDKMSTKDAQAKIAAAARTK